MYEQSDVGNRSTSPLQCYKNLNHYSNVIGCWDIHWRVQLLEQHLHTSVDISTWNKPAWQMLMPGCVSPASGWNVLLIVKLSLETLADFACVHWLLGHMRLSVGFTNHSDLYQLYDVAMLSSITDPTIGTNPCHTCVKLGPWPEASTDAMLMCGIIFIGKVWWSSQGAPDIPSHIALTSWWRRLMLA